MAKPMLDTRGMVTVWDLDPAVQKIVSANVHTANAGELSTWTFDQLTEWSELQVIKFMMNPSSYRNGLKSVMHEICMTNAEWQRARA